MTRSVGTSGKRHAAELLTAATVVLRDGSSVAVVPMQTTDSARLMRFHGTLSSETTYSRFFSFHPQLNSAELHRFTHVDHRDREALVAVADEEIVGVARFDRLPSVTEAEVAFVVADSWQGRGVGRLLFDRLGQLALEVGVDRFIADTFPHNRRMLAVFRHANLPMAERVEDGVVHLTLQLRAAPPSGVMDTPERQHMPGGRENLGSGRPSTSIGDGDGG